MLKAHLDMICDEIWKRLEQSKFYGIIQGEETLTDNLLLHLAIQNLSEIKIIKTSKNLEGIQGTDWEWWIGNRSEGYLRYAVQAKKLGANGVYPCLKHKVGKGANAQYQHIILEQYATANQAIPLYAFYNHLDKKNCPNTWNCQQQFDLSKLGCTVTPLKNVKKSLGNRGWRTFDKIHSFQDTVPLRCLVGCRKIDFQNAKIYDDPLPLFKEMQQSNDVNQLPKELYNHELGYYPKKILLMTVNEICSELI